MIYASIIVEALRARPKAVFWLMALSQTALWFLVPSLFYSAPPGNLAELVAIGREVQFVTIAGPPLAPWLADIAFRLAGGSLIGVYLLAQICVLIALWSLFTLGRSVVGGAQSVLAVLILVGVAALTVATPDFGPAVLATPIWSLVLLHLWRALGENQRSAWFALAIELGLLLLTTTLAPLLVALVAIMVVATAAGRAALRTPAPWLCAAMVAVIVAPYALWIALHADPVRPMLETLRHADAKRAGITWLRLLGGIVLAHAGVVVLVALASGWPFDRKQRVPLVERDGIAPFARRYVLTFAVAPAITATLAVALLGKTDAAGLAPLVSAAPLVVLSGLGIVVIADDSIRLHRQRILAYGWIALLFAPPILTVLAVTVLPRLLAVDVRVAQPAAEIGKFFAETFERRTGKPLAIVTGEPRLAELIAVSAASRPHLFVDAATTPWIAPDDVRAQGAVVVWTATDTAGTPPPEIKARYPGLVPEVPHIFDRAVQGWLPLMRVGWAVIRPGGR